MSLVRPRTNNCGPGRKLYQRWVCTVAKQRSNTLVMFGFGVACYIKDFLCVHPSTPVEELAESLARVSKDSWSKRSNSTILSGKWFITGIIVTNWLYRNIGLVLRWKHYCCNRNIESDFSSTVMLGKMVHVHVLLSWIIGCMHDLFFIPWLRQLYI